MRLEYLIQNNLMRILESLYSSLIVGNICDQLRGSLTKYIPFTELFVHCFAVNDMNDFSVNIFSFEIAKKSLQPTFTRYGLIPSAFGSLVFI